MEATSTQHIRRVVVSAAVMIGLLSAHRFASVAAAPGDEGSHIRLSDRGLKALVERGLVRSATFRSLVAQLDAAPILVFGECDLYLPTNLGARLNLITSVGSVRYVRVALQCGLPLRLQLALLGHEFQHALEIAHNPDIVDADSMESYYEDMGFSTYHDGTHRAFETEAALAVQRLVDHEVNQPPTPTPTP